MFERLKTIVTGVKYVWQYAPTLTSMLRRLAEYPGLDDSEKLRLWLRPLVLDFSVLTSLTKNTIDDVISRTAIQIIDNAKAWTAVYSLAMLVNDNQNEGTVKVLPVENNEKISDVDDLRNKVAEAYYNVTDEIRVENPTIIISAIGLIIQLIRLLRK
jgi:lipoate synthase